MANIQESIFQSIDTITKVAMDKMKVDKTISAIITKCTDLSKREYEVNYQGPMKVYAQPYDITYTEGQQVYILVPEGDFSNKKIIMGLSEVSDKPQGQSIVFPSGEAGALIKTISDAEYLSVKNKRKTLDYEAVGDLQNKIKNSDVVILKGSFYAGSLESQYRTSAAHYGVTVNLKMKNDTILPLSLDSKKMSGTPLYYSTFTPQQLEFNIDKDNFESIDSIEFYALDFAVGDEEGNEEDYKQCIGLKDFQITVGDTNNVYGDYTVRLSYSPSKIIGETEDNLETTVTLQLISGNVVLDSSLYSVSWYKNSINTEDDGLAGPGWEELAAQKNSLTVTADDLSSYKNNFKCIISIRESGDSAYRIQEEFIIFDYTERYFVRVDTPTTSIKNGTVTFTCNIVDKQTNLPIVAPEGTSYLWVLDNSVLSEQSNALSIDGSTFTGSHRYTCIASFNNFVGSDTVTIDKDIVEQVLPYYVRIVNGDQIFRYDSNGYSPAYEGRNEPQYIRPLRGELYYNADDEPVDVSNYVCFWEYNEGSLINTITPTGADCEFTIKDTYDKTSKDNQITCIINYEGKTYRQETNFTFTGPEKNGVAEFTKVNVNDDNLIFVSNRGSVKLPSVNINGYIEEVEWEENSSFLEINDGYVSCSLGETGTPDDFILFAENKKVFYPLPYVFYKNDEVEVTLKSLKQDGYPLLKEVTYDYAGLNPKYNANNDFNKVVYVNGEVKTLWPDEGRVTPDAVYDSNKINYMIADTDDFKIFIPIYVHYETETQPMFNGWDGRSIQLGDNGYIATPQLAAGRQDENGFTGLALGEFHSEEGESQTGLFGYQENQRTIFLDAENGRAEFGPHAEIILDANGSTIGGWIIGTDQLSSAERSIVLDPVDNEDEPFDPKETGIQLHLGGADTLAVYNNKIKVAGIDSEGYFYSIGSGKIDSDGVFVGYLTPTSNGLQIQNPNAEGLMARLVKLRDTDPLQIIAAKDNTSNYQDIELYGQNIKLYTPYNTGFLTHNEHEIYEKESSIRWGSSTPANDDYYSDNYPQEGSLYIQYFTNSPARTWIYVNGEWK